MRQLIPVSVDVDDADLYAELDWGGSDGAVAAGMAIGLDGGVTVDGTSRAIGAQGDAVAFRALRDAADAIVVGAGTARAESYGPVVRRPAVLTRREARGQRPAARLVVVTRRLLLEPDDRIFADGDNPPLLVTTTSADHARVARLADAGVTIWQLGTGDVDLAALRTALFANGMRRVLCEGGPALLTGMLQANLVDELFVTLAPLLTGSGERLVVPPLAQPIALELRSAVQAGSELLLRYRVVR